MYYLINQVLLCNKDVVCNVIKYCNENSMSLTMSFCSFSLQLLNNT